MVTAAGARWAASLSAILTIIEDKSAEQLINRMSPYQAQVVTLTVGDETSGEIAQAVAIEVEGPAPESSSSAAIPAAEAPKSE